MRGNAVRFASLSLVVGCGGTVVETASQKDPGADGGHGRHAGDPDAQGSLPPSDPGLRGAGDAGRVADAGVSTCASSYRCPGPTFPVEATGTLHAKQISVTRAAVEYERGATNSTLLSFQAVWGGEPATVLVTLRNSEGGVPAAQVPPGTYETSSPEGSSSVLAPAAFVSVATCTTAESLAPVAIYIVEHSGTAFGAAPVRLTGELSISAAPFSFLTIPFVIEAVCALHDGS